MCWKDLNILSLYNYSDGLASAKICEISWKDKSDVSRNLNIFVKDGIVEKKVSHQKGYGENFYLTEKGKNLLIICEKR